MQKLSFQKELPWMPVPVTYLLFLTSFLTPHQFKQHSYMLNDEISNSSPDPQISTGQGTSYSACVPLRILIFLNFHTATFSQGNNHNFFFFFGAKSSCISPLHIAFYLLVLTKFLTATRKLVCWASYWPKLSHYFFVLFQHLFDASLLLSHQ